ncbi:MAG: CDP-glucose 4,6-dehydratase [Dokdonella sp.]
MKRLFHGAFAGTRVLVTGHTGFKGSWLCLWLQALGAEVIGFALPPATEPAHWSLLQLEGVQEWMVDLRDPTAIRSALNEAQPQVIFHLAAQSLVRRSYDAPVETFATNVTGLVNLFEGIRACASVRAVVNATTDKVYQDHATLGGYNEKDPLGGHDPYSTSKACAELVSECYRKSYFSGVSQHAARVATARAGNVIGGGDWADERLVPDLVRAAAAGTPLRIRHPDAVRPWQHVLEPLSGYLQLGQRLLAGEAIEGGWNFGPARDATLPVRELAARLLARWPGVRIELATGQHPHEAALLTLDCSKAARELGWRPVWDAEVTIQRTIDWYRAFHDSGHLRSTDDLCNYVADARNAGLEWARMA